MKKIRLFTAAVVFATVAVSSGFAQFTSEDNLGADCGCPAVSARTTSVNLSSLADANGVLTSSVVLTCNKMWILDKKIYVPDGKSITIMPGTVVKGNFTALPADAVALIISRGGKIFASGEPTCPIVFTASADNLDGNYPICNRGKWGGIVLLGKAPNNLIAANVYNPKGGPYAGIPGYGFVEGFDGANPNNVYGAPYGQTDDNDNSGIMKYVSIRHAGAILAVANELNGLSLGSVGRGTTIDHIEIVAADDDNIEFFGGRVNVKYIACYWGADDQFDYDLGWQGNAQFLFAIHTPDRVAVYSSDNGYEADSDDDKVGDLATGGGPAFIPAHPIIYNSTLIGAGNASTASDYTGPSAIRAKERTEGEIYNSIFANWMFGLDMSDTRSALPAINGTTDALQNWNAGSLIVKNNTFVNMTDATYGAPGLCVSTKNGKGAGTAAVRRVATATESAKFTADGNTYQASIPGFDFALGMTTPAGVDQQSTITHKFDAVPSADIAGGALLARDLNNGFFKNVTYRGAFGATEKNWLSGWGMIEDLNVTPGLKPCPSDLDFSGSTGPADVNVVLGAFGTSCQK